MLATRTRFRAVTRLPVFRTMRRICLLRPSLSWIKNRLGERRLTTAGRVLPPRMVTPVSSFFRALSDMGDATVTMYSFSWSKDGCSRWWWRFPSLVMSNRPVESLSRRPTGKMRCGISTKSKTIFSFFWLQVVTYDRGLWRAMYTGV